MNIYFYIYLKSVTYLQVYKKFKICKIRILFFLNVLKKKKIKYTLSDEKICSFKILFDFKGNVWVISI